MASIHNRALHEGTPDAGPEFIDPTDYGFAVSGERNSIPLGHYALRAGELDYLDADGFLPMQEHEHSTARGDYVALRDSNEISPTN